jgi:hypothetical protein
MATMLLRGDCIDYAAYGQAGRVTRVTVPYDFSGPLD